MELSYETTLPAVLARSATLFGSRTALAAIGGRSFTYAELLASVDAARARLTALGIAPGDRVAILSENRPEWGIAYFAILAHGAIAVPILSDFPPPETQNILRHSESSAAFVSNRLKPKIEGADLPHLRGMVAIEVLAELETRPIDEVLRTFAPLPSVTPHSLAAIVYTSGTTGFSKGVMLSHRNIAADAVSTLSMVKVEQEDRMLSILPLGHTYECTLGLVTPLMVGAAVYYLDKPPSAGVLLPAMALVRPTIILSVPLVIEKIFKARIQPLLARPLLRPVVRFRASRLALSRLIGRKLGRMFGGSLHLFCIGGAPLAADVEEFLRDSGFPYAIGYGLTETAPLASGDGPATTRLHAAGRALPGVSVRIDQPDPVTGHGEILIKGPNVMLGYYKDPARTAEVLDAEGWFHTGDLGALDEDGYVFIKGRIKNMILGPSGKNIYPEEIEAALNEYDLVLESVVFQQQNKLMAKIHLNYEELRKRFALHNKTDHQVKEHITAVLEDIRKRVNERLAHFSRLHRVIDQPEPFEKTPTQKIKRHLYQ